MPLPGDRDDVPPEIQEHLLEESYKRGPRFFIIMALLGLAGAGTLALLAVNSLGLVGAGQAARSTLVCTAPDVGNATRTAQNAWFAQHQLTRNGAVSDSEVVVATVGQPPATGANDMFVVWNSSNCSFQANGVPDNNGVPVYPPSIKTGVNFNQSEFTQLGQQVDAAIPLPSDAGLFLFGPKTDGASCGSLTPPVFSPEEVDGNNALGVTVKFGTATRITMSCT